jgi:hypothetical protein
LVREAANTHTEAIAAIEDSLQAKIEAMLEVKRVKEAMACQAEKDWPPSKRSWRWPRKWQRMPLMTSKPWWSVSLLGH